MIQSSRIPSDQGSSVVPLRGVDLRLRAWMVDGCVFRGALPWECGAFAHASDTSEDPLQGAVRTRRGGTGHRYIDRSLHGRWSCRDDPKATFRRSVRVTNRL